MVKRLADMKKDLTKMSEKTLSKMKDFMSDYQTG